MSIDPGFFIHESDKAALDTLKSIPGFTPFIKGFMKVWNEKQFRILNLSSRLRVSEEQLPKYHRMLVPICEKLGIAVPELYIELNVQPNAYTYGDNEPFIVLTSGLIETMPEELIPTVLAHECGHIVCHHTLYTTMGSVIMAGAAALSGLGSLISLPLQYAFAYWMRCSEFSADRAAIVYDGTPDKMVEVCMRFAGLDQRINDYASKEVFLKQAEEYRQFVKDDAWNQTLETLILANQRHPLTAIRAYEADVWGKSEDFLKIRLYLAEEEAGTDHEYVPMTFSAEGCIGKDVSEVRSRFEKAGIGDITMNRIMDGDPGLRCDQVTAVAVEDQPGFPEYSWLRKNSRITLTYYSPYSSEEVRSRFPGKVRIPESYSYCIGKNAYDVYKAFTSSGFTNVTAERQKSGRPLFARDEEIVRVTINGTSRFEKGELAEESDPVVIYYW